MKAQEWFYLFYFHVQIQQNIIVHLQLWYSENMENNQAVLPLKPPVIFT